MKKSTYLSATLLLIVVAWMFSGAFANVPEKQISNHTKQNVATNNTLSNNASDKANEKSLALMKVKVANIEAQSVTREIIAQGVLEPFRQIEIQSQADSKVVDIAVDKGNRVFADTLLFKLDEQDRKAQIKRAQADVNTQRFELNAAKKLRKQGLQAENKLNASHSALALAQAQLKQAQLQLQHTRIKAPFSGIVEQRYVEIGTHVEPGEKLALIVDESILKAVAYISQQSVNQIKLGQTVYVTLLDGRKAQGKVSYISRLGDSETHSFRVEAEIPNINWKLNAGVSTELRIAIGTEKAHFISPALFTLNNSGAVGVKGVDNKDTVIFYPISMVKSEAQGIWVSGLPQHSTIITQGQAFVNSGEIVIPVPNS